MQQSYKWNILALKRMRNSYKLGKVVVWEYDYQNSFHKKVISQLLQYNLNKQSTSLMLRYIDSCFIVPQNKYFYYNLQYSSLVGQYYNYSVIGTPSIFYFLKFYNNSDFGTKTYKVYYVRGNGEFSRPDDEILKQLFDKFPNKIWTFIYPIILENTYKIIIETINNS